MITVSAPGKIHLIGEYSVVWGGPAIISAVGKRITVTAEKCEKVRYIDKRFDERADEWGVNDVLETADREYELWKKCNEKGDYRELLDFAKKDRFSGYRKGIVGMVLKRLGKREGVSLVIEGGVPVGAGLGGSSSLVVAVTKAMCELFGEKMSERGLNNMAFEMEKFSHGAPSGGDNSASCFGGLIWFKRGEPNTIESLREEIPYKLDNFVLVYTKTPEKSTGELVQMVRELDPDIREPAIKAIGTATYEMREALKERDFVKTQELINLAQRKLKQLGVSTPEIDRVVETVQGIGGAAKLCGAGGGGVMLCYHDDKEKLISTIKELGFEPIEADLGVEGVKIEH